MHVDAPLCTATSAAVSDMTERSIIALNERREGIEEGAQRQRPAFLQLVNTMRFQIWLLE